MPDPIVADRRDPLPEIPRMSLVTRKPIGPSDALLREASEVGPNPVAQQLWAERVAERWNHARMRRDVELNCRLVLALQRYHMRYSELSTQQQCAINHDVACVLTIFSARMTDHEFAFLSSDARRLLEPEKAGRS